VKVQRELVLRRTASNCFAGKHGFITPRDLFRWAERGAISYQDLAENGFLILGERLRDAQEREVVASVLQSCLRGAKLDMAALYAREGGAPIEQLSTALAARPVEELGAAEALQGVVWTDSMRRMYTLLERCWRCSSLPSNRSSISHTPFSIGSLPPMDSLLIC
jgi:midasin